MNMKINKFIICSLLSAASVIQIQAQDNEPKKKPSKAWEIGIGGSVMQFNRIGFSNFNRDKENGYVFDLELKHAVWGGNIYIARELNPNLFFDVQATGGFTKYALSADNKNKWYYMVGAGLQWRFGEYFGSKYVDPYIRAGINYMYKDFDILYKGSEGLSPDEMKWVMENFDNKDGRDRHHLMPVTMGVGLNTWLNDNFGIGMQADYVLMPYTKVANSIQGTARLMWRIGGKSKKPQSTIEIVEVERIVEKPVIVEKIVEKEVVKEKEIKELCDFFNNINFEFNKAELTAESKKIVEYIAEVLKQDTSKKYLITGYTDAVGSEQYNISLSRRRAAAVVDYLIENGVPRSIIKSRGVGKKISYANAGESDDIRRGDRKVTVEVITNMHYWNYLPSNDL